MKLEGHTLYISLVEEYPFIVTALAEFNPRFSALQDDQLAGLLGPSATLAKLSRLGQLSLTDLLVFIAGAIRRETGEQLDVDAEGYELLQRAKREQLKLLLGDLHHGHDPQEIKRRFAEFIEDVSPEEIAEVEQALVAAGVPVAEIHRLCDVHVEVFKGAPSLYGAASAPAGHPVQTFMAENREFERCARRLCELLPGLGSPPDEVPYVLAAAELKQLVSDLSQIELHYQRKEHQLFPFLEKHAITTPPKVMWAAHDEVRAQLKEVRRALNMTDLPALVKHGSKVGNAVLEMIFKEEHILLPMALTTLSEEEWADVLRGEREIGYALVTPDPAWAIEKLGPSAPSAAIAGGLISLDTGALTAEQLNLILTHLPVELSFVDESDTVRFYSHGTRRIFARTPAVIGRNVENCHPASSLHVVRRIIEAFRQGERDVAEFWIPFNQMLVHIRYFAVRDSAGAYRGTLEVVQDITDIQELSGRQRLLDWK
jgi:uncharacterized protein